MADDEAVLYKVEADSYKTTAATYHLLDISAKKVEENAKKIAKSDENTELKLLDTKTVQIRGREVSYIYYSYRDTDMPAVNHVTAHMWTEIEGRGILECQVTESIVYEAPPFERNTAMIELLFSDIE